MIPRVMLAILLPVLAPAMAVAQDAASTFQAPEIASGPSVPASDAKPSGPFAKAQALDSAKLQRVAGREDVNQISQADLAATVSRNSIGDNSMTGEARIDGNAFQNMSGLSILNVNTGNNVAINAAMNVNVSISPAP